MNATRRDVLRTGVGVTGWGLAGCLGSIGSTPTNQSTDGSRVQTSFFVLYDLARHVAGDAATVESVVPFGQHGHGWEPSSSVVRDVVSSDAFVYVGPGFQPWADDLVRTVESDAPEVTVVEARRGIELLEAGGGHDHEADNDEKHEEDDHDADPHFWLDPRRAKRAVENVRDGLIETDPGSEAAFRDGAADYLERLDALDETFETALADTERDAVLVAGHDAFGYLAHRYGFEVHALTGIAPDAEPSAKAIREAQAVVEEHGIRHVLAPALESTKAADQLVAETDAEVTLPITSIAGRTDEWRERDWGYVEIMEEVNLPSLETALGAQ